MSVKGREADKIKQRNKKIKWKSESLVLFRLRISIFCNTSYTAMFFFVVHVIRTGKSKKLCISKLNCSLRSTIYQIGLPSNTATPLDLSGGSLRKELYAEE